MKLNVGQPLPAFELVTTDKKIITNKDIEGRKVLFLFFPAAFTSTCTKELCSVRDDIARYNNAAVEVIGISTDAVYSLIKYKEEQQLNFLLAADFNKEVSAAFGSSYEIFNFHMKGVSKRSAFLVDESGIIQYEEVLDNAGAIPDFDAIHKAILTLNN